MKDLVKLSQEKSIHVRQSLSLEPTKTTSMLCQSIFEATFEVENTSTGMKKRLLELLEDKLVHPRHL